MLNETKWGHKIHNFPKDFVKLAVTFPAGMRLIDQLPRKRSEGKKTPN
jgi:hypothetical protein